eukprot:1138290-Pelagomonas_calceolata.AAC.3
MESDLNPPELMLLSGQFSKSKVAAGYRSDMQRIKGDASQVQLCAGLDRVLEGFAGRPKGACHTLKQPGTTHQMPPRVEGFVDSHAAAP